MKATNIIIQKTILNDYQNGLSNKEISLKYNLHRSTIQRILIRNNIVLRKQNETARKYEILNENYFKFIDSEKKAYILGLLFADGYINKNGFGITLMEDDKELLEKISKIIYGKIVLNFRKGRIDSRNIKYKSKPQYRFEVTSLKMKNDLIKHGCVKAKTFKIRLPQLDKKLYSHFIRGYFDGDGSICIPTKKTNNVIFTITSNIKFCDDIAKYVNNNNNLNVNMKSIIRYGDIGMNRLTGRKQIIRFLNWLYDNATIFMNRKQTKFKLIKTNMKENE